MNEVPLPASLAYLRGLKTLYLCGEDLDITAKLSDLPSGHYLAGKCHGCKVRLSVLAVPGVGPPVAATCQGGSRPLLNSPAPHNCCCRA
jgi:hypothetical protein